MGQPIGYSVHEIQTRLHWQQRVGQQRAYRREAENGPPVQPWSDRFSSGAENSCPPSNSPVPMLSHSCGCRSPRTNSGRPGNYIYQYNDTEQRPVAVG